MNRNSLPKQSTPSARAQQMRCDIAGLLDVRQQFDRLGIQRHRRRVPQARQALALQRDLALLETILGQDDGRRVDDHRPASPSMITQSSWRTSWLAPRAPTTAGMSMLRATMAV